MFVPSHHLLAILFVAYFTSAFLFRSLLVWRRTGINPCVLADSEGAEGYVARNFRRVMLGLFAYIGAQAAFPQVLFSLGPLMMPLAVAGIGWVLLFIALFLTIVAQAQMGVSWRIGIDTQHETPLVTQGLFQHSRNPIFLAMRLALLGLCMVQANAITLMLGIVGEILMQLQVRFEEQYLESVHGEIYRHYRMKVRRWL
jgi:protein-S-isoprenylcysteine O-methyltransferase Ste14